MVLNIAFLFGCMSWFSKAMEEQQIKKQEEQLYKIISKEKAHKNTEVKLWMESNLLSESKAYKEKYKTEYQEEYIKLVSIYRDYEDNWDTYKKELDGEKHWVKQLIGGNFNYAMMLDEIKQIIKDKFIVMKRKGLIISKDEYEKIKSIYINSSTRDLTRIWGAEYLKFGIECYKNKKYDIPGYKIVSNNPDNITVILYPRDKRFPVVSKLKVGGAFIDFVKIIGSQV